MCNALFHVIHRKIKMHALLLTARLFGPNRRNIILVLLEQKIYSGILALYDDPFRVSCIFFPIQQLCIEIRKCLCIFAIQHNIV